MGKKEGKASSTLDLERFPGSVEVFEATVTFSFCLSLNIYQPQGQSLLFWLLAQVYPTAGLPHGKVRSLLRSESDWRHWGSGK